MIRATDFSRCLATVVGYGNMGREYVRALSILGVKKIRVCSRSRRPLPELEAMGSVEVIFGSLEDLRCSPIDSDHELAIVATPISTLVAVSENLALLGFRRLLVEKPISLWSAEIGKLADSLERQGVHAACAYNRVAYPSFVEARARSEREGGITSGSYTFTEIVKTDWPQRFPPEELARWGVANSLHVMSMAHGLIGLPAKWSGYRSGAISWHPAGSIVAGSGISVQGIPFIYHADWSSKGRWSVEIHTREASYRLCPLEKLFRKRTATGEWEEVAVVSVAAEAKPGVLEQVAAMLAPEVGCPVPLMDLRRTLALTTYAEDILGYSAGDGC